MGGTSSFPAKPEHSLQHQFMANSILQMACDHNGNNHEMKYVQQSDKSCTEHYNEKLEEIFNTIKEEHTNKFATCTFDNLFTSDDCKSSMFEFLKARPF